MEEQRTTTVRESDGVVDGDHVQQETVATDRTISGTTLFKRVIWFIVGFINVLLAARVVLLLLGAQEDSGFVSFVYAISAPFAAPFYGMFAYQPTYGVSTLEVSSLVAMAVYTLIAWGLTKLLTLNKPSVA